MTILCLGCSWTDKYHKDVAPWPEVIESKTGEKVVNLGLNGSGNRYAYDQFLNYIRTEEKPTTVYWLMTEFDRVDTLLKTHRHGIFTFKTLTQGRDQERYLERWGENYLESHSPGEAFEKSKKLVGRDAQLASLLADIYHPTDFIDYNLHMMYVVQRVCDYYNIKLRIGLALLPLQPFLIPEANSQDLGWAILKSKYSDKLKKQNLIGWPFYKEFGGMTGNQIKSWGKTYGITDVDNHPGAKGSRLLASFFLAEKDIKDYK